MSMAFIRKSYGVSAKQGGRVEYTGNGKPEFGIIAGASGARLRIRMNGERHSRLFHPTWKLRFLTEGGKP